MQSTLIRLYGKFSLQFSQSIPFITMWPHPKRIKKTHPTFFFGVVLIPWFFFLFLEIASVSEYLQCFCSINGFTLKSKHQKGSVFALILCLYWAGGGFKPSSKFGVYSKLSDLRAIYWCSISYVYREAHLSLEQIKNSHNILAFPLASTSAETLSCIQTVSLPCACPETHKVALPWQTGLGNRNAERGNPISLFMLFG